MRTRKGWKQTQNGVFGARNASGVAQRFFCSATFKETEATELGFWVAGAQNSPVAKSTSRVQIEKAMMTTSTSFEYDFFADLSADEFKASDFSAAIAPTTNEN